ncbi:hypothetical protein Alches_20440 [Alicyclobacillus hesperidum subsp. aegles]|nr:hypothetical protein Alches_20440 [Alicyclobacillus hesperidum subsp. aegles]
MLPLSQRWHVVRKGRAKTRKDTVQRSWLRIFEIAATRTPASYKWNVYTGCVEPAPIMLLLTVFGRQLYIGCELARMSPPGDAYTWD